ncbi:MAG TPA: O-methyltransferase [Phycisphaerae bacterium]|nr:O-methyltransferase [Phycisphaerae bacterium]
MRHPAYQLRPYKAVDRALLIDILTRLDGYATFSSSETDYTYYSLGGPFLEDFRLIQQRFPDIALVSIESDHHTFRRQKFHRPSKRIRLVRKSLSDFIAEMSDSGPSIFWLDYIDNTYARFDEFMKLLSQVGERSIVKVTLRAEMQDWRLNTEEKEKALSKEVADLLEKRFLEDFRIQYSNVAPTAVEPSMFRENRFPKLLQDMLQIAAEKALPAGTGLIFQPLASTRYSDKTQMLSLVGIVCSPGDRNEISDRLKTWRFANLDWSDPALISLPVLSIKERLHLDKYLPETKPDGKSLVKALGYNVDDDRKSSVEMMAQYSACHSHYPHFARVMV